MFHTTEALVGATHLSRPQSLTPSLSMFYFDRPRYEPTVRIATVGKPNRRALNTRLLSAIG